MTRLTAGFCCLLRKRGCVRSERSHSGKTGKKVFGLLRQASCAPGNGAVMFVPHITAPCSFVAYLSHILQLPSVASLRSVCIPAKQADTREPSHTCIAGMPLLLHVTATCRSQAALAQRLCYCTAGTNLCLCFACHADASHVVVRPSCSFLTLLALPPLAPWRVVATVGTPSLRCVRSSLASFIRTSLPKGL